MSFIEDQDSAIVLSSTMRYCPPCTSPFDSMWPALLFEQKLLLGTLGNCIHNDPPASTRRPMISRSLIPRKTSLLMARSFSNRPLLWSSAALKKQKQQKNKCPKRPPSTLPPYCLEKGNEEAEECLSETWKEPADGNKREGTGAEEIRNKSYSTQCIRIHRGPVRNERTP